jgi:hypothetical protein
MTSQLISLLIIIAVLVIEFIINGRKKNVDDTQKRIEGFEGLKKFNLSEYLLIRKKNVVIFILLAILSKPLIHSYLFPDTKEEVNYNKKVLDNVYSRDFYILNSKGELFHNTDTLPFSGLADLSLDGKAYTKKREKYIVESMGGDSLSNVFYYPLETMPLSFNEHLEVMFKSKLWIFLVSIGAMTVIVFLFNDKIKAR